MLKFSSALSSALVSVTSKQAWCEAVIAALGSTRRVICKKSATAGDVWGTGTTFLDISLTGSMAVVGFQVANLGVMSTITTQTAVDLATGFAVLRIEGATSATWVEGTIGLPGSGADFILRANLTALGMGVGFTAAALIRAPSRLPDSSSGATLTTISLVNTSGSTQAANFVSPMLGMPIKQGDVTSGDYLAFTLSDDTPIPATIYNDTSWPDLSKKFCGVLLRPPASIAGSGTMSVKVKSGGSATGASSRSLSDLTAADIKVELTGVTNLSGVWVASLNTAITDAEEILVIGDGPAGKVWRIRGAFKQSGVAHGQLVCWHYVAALQDSGGGFMGLRYLGRVSQPWLDVATPSPTRRVLSAVLKSGASTIRTLSGHDTTETPGANFSINHYASFFTCGADGKWDYVQGGGSASADCTVRVQHNKVYIVKSRLLPPYDTTVAATSSASVDYVANCRGAAETRALDSTGPSNFIGILPQWSIRHLMTQAAVDERAVRVSSLAAGGFRILGRRSTTGQVVPAASVSASYTGMGTNQPSWRFGGSFFDGVQVPTDQTSLWSGDTNCSHRGSFHYYPYLITGEPQYRDMLVETAAHVIISTPAGAYTRNVGTGITSLRNGSYTGFRDIRIGAGGTVYNGAGVLFIDGGVRVSAWAARDLAQGLALSPDTEPDGTAVKAYFSDVLNSACSAVNDMNSQMPTSWQNAGLFSTTQDTATSTGSDTLYESPWMTMYMSQASCHAYEITRMASAQTFRQHLSKFISSVHATMDVTCITSYRWNQWKADGTLVDNISDVLFYLDSTLTFDTGTDRATLSGARGTWTPTNGDRFSFSTNIDADKPFASAANNAKFFAVNSSGATFQLSATNGGSAIDVTTAASISPYFAALANAAPLTTIENGSYYRVLAYEAARVHEAAGDSVVASARAKLDANVTSAGVTFTADPRSAVLASYPA